MKTSRISPRSSSLGPSIRTFRWRKRNPPSISKLARTLSTLASTQQTFKGLDGAAHEAYQRTHSGDDVHDISVSGRAQRSASRLAAVAEAFYACELVEVAEHPESLHDEALRQKEIILNITLGSSATGSGSKSGEEHDFSFSVLVIYEPNYNGGIGLEHGSILSLMRSPSTSETAENDGNRNLQRPGVGRLLVVLGDTSSLTVAQKIQLLDEAPKKIKLSSGLVTNEIASVQPTLYREAGKLLTLLEPQLRQYNTSAVHFVGHSLAGGVASLAATMLDGSIPMPKKRPKSNASSSKGKKKRRKSTSNDEKPSDDSPNDDNPEGESEEEDSEEKAVPLEPLCGLGRARASALTLGSPPCLSSNVVAAFCTSFVYGDDILCRTTKGSIDRLVGRIEKHLHSGFIGKKLGWVSDTMSLTVASLQSHAHGSEGEEEKLAIPGRAYLVRPRRLGGICSIHEVGNLKKGGREALREALLWQLHDVLLSASMWKHHNLESYIQGLDRTQLRGVADDEMHLLDQ
eukprot:jgi/Psemu1/296662/fgenesh1_pm.183_\